MKIRALVLFLGCLFIVIPFLGIPYNWKQAVVFVAGVLLLWTSSKIPKVSSVDGALFK
jgi:VIT1/CCC1 family predicted Fe2+/Mn2+ transporter